MNEGKRLIMKEVLVSVWAFIYAILMTIMIIIDRKWGKSTERIRRIHRCILYGAIGGVISIVSFYIVRDSVIFFIKTDKIDIDKESIIVCVIVEVLLGIWMGHKGISKEKIKPDDVIEKLKKEPFMIQFESSGGFEDTVNELKKQIDEPFDLYGFEHYKLVYRILQEWINRGNEVGKKINIDEKKIYLNYLDVHYQANKDNQAPDFLFTFMSTLLASLLALLAITELSNENKLYIAVALLLFFAIALLRAYALQDEPKYIFYGKIVAQLREELQEETQQPQEKERILFHASAYAAAYKKNKRREKSGS